MVVLPPAILADPGHRAAKSAHSRDPGPSHAGATMSRCGGPRPRVRAIAPLASSSGERAGVPPFLRDNLRALGGDDIARLILQVTHHLPTYRGVGVQQPLHNSRVCSSPLLHRITNGSVVVERTHGKCQPARQTSGISKQESDRLRPGYAVRVVRSLSAYPRFAQEAPKIIDKIWVFSKSVTSAVTLKLRPDYRRGSTWHELKAQ